MNTEAIKDHIARELRQATGVGVMQGDPVVHVNAALRVAVDAVNMALQLAIPLANESYQRGKEDAQADQRRAGYIYLGAAILYGQYDAMTFETAAADAAELWDELQLILQWKQPTEGEP